MDIFIVWLIPLINGGGNYGRYMPRAGNFKGLYPTLPNVKVVKNGNEIVRTRSIQLVGKAQSIRRRAPLDSCYAVRKDSDG